MGPQSFRESSSSHLIFSSQTDRASQILVHELLHVIGMPHIAGPDPGHALTFTDTTVEPEETYDYTTIGYPDCEHNSVGAWTCDEENIEAGYCTEEEKCCGLFAMKDYSRGPDVTCLAPGYLNAAYSPSYADIFTIIIDSWLRRNEIVPTSTSAPDGSCALHTDQYTCAFDDEGNACYWDLASASCEIIPADQAAGVIHEMEVDVGKLYSGDTANYFSEVANTWSVEVESKYQVTALLVKGRCVWKVKCFDGSYAAEFGPGGDCDDPWECDPVRNSQPHFLGEIWNDDMTELLLEWSGSEHNCT